MSSNSPDFFSSYSPSDHNPTDHEVASPPLRLPSFRSLIEGQNSGDPPVLPTFAMPSTVIDLTGDTSPVDIPRLSREQSSHPSQPSQPSRKRRRVSDGTLRPDGPSRSRPTRLHDSAEATPGNSTEVTPEIDLTLSGAFGRFGRAGIPWLPPLPRCNNDACHEQRQQEQHKQQKEILKQQDKLLKESITTQESGKQGPLRISKLACVICLETMTDMTATHCGHLFCHQCLISALTAAENQGSEPGKGQPRCPVCRKKVLRVRRAGQRDLQQVIPLELKLKTRGSRGSKGKEKENVETIL